MMRSHNGPAAARELAKLREVRAAAEGVVALADYLATQLPALLEVSRMADCAVMARLRAAIAEVKRHG